MEDRQKNLENVIWCIKDLPALPSVVGEVLQITDDPTIAISQLSESIQRDPALTAKILKVSNSSYYGMKQYVGSLKLALVVLGVREVRNIVLGISIIETLDNSHTGTFTKDLWDHSFQVAALCKKLGSALSLGLQGEDFISGLLHDIGKLVIFRQMGTAYDVIYDASGGSGDALCTMEAQNYGFDHADMAAALALHWNLPLTLADALWYHHTNPERQLTQAKDPKLAAIVRIADLAVHDDFAIADTPHHSCMEEATWAILNSPRTPQTVAAREEMLLSFLGEVGPAAELML